MSSTVDTKCAQTDHPNTRRYATLWSFRAATLPIAAALLSTFSLLAKDKQPKVYPEKGTVVAFRIGEHSLTSGVYTDPYGKTHGGGTVHLRTHIYRVVTETRFYELESGKKAMMELNESVQFRVEKGFAYVQRGNKEQKYLIVGIEQKRTSPSNERDRPCSHSKKN